VACREEASHSPGVELDQIDASGGFGSPHELAGDQESRNHEEDIDATEAAAERSNAGVEE